MSILKKKSRVVLLLSGAVVLGFVSLLISIRHEALSWALWRDFHTDSVAPAFDRTDPELFFEIGNYYFGGGAYDTQKAEKYFRAALALDPNMEGPHYQLARINFIHSDFNDAASEINKEIELHPDFGRSHYVRGLIYGYSGRLLEAETEFRKFLNWKPDSWAGNNDLAWIYFQEGKYAEALEVARAGLAITPNNPWLLNSLGVALLNTNDKKGAKEAFIGALTFLNAMTEREWGAAYPGNDPNIYGNGFSKMKESIAENLKLLATVDSATSHL
jgi:tetratricopeptide (TPR) repeat protein